MCRCHACNVRFARLFRSVVHIDNARRAATLLLMLAGAVLVPLVMLWLMNKQAAIGPSDALLEMPIHTACPTPLRTLPA